MARKQDNDMKPSIHGIDMLVILLAIIPVAGVIVAFATGNPWWLLLLFGLCLFL